MQEKMDTEDHPCAGAYEASAAKVNALTDKQYEDWLKSVLKKAK